MEAAIPNAGPYTHEFKIVSELATQAGAIALRYHGTALEVDRKPGNEPVTLADRECSEFLVEAMSSAFPDDVIISEEGNDDLRRLEPGRVWYIDPIDGTKDFIDAGTSYCIMLGLAVNHRPVFGVLYQPNHDALIYAMQGGGSWCQRSGQTHRLRCSPMSDPANARLLARQGGDRQEVERILGIPQGHRLRSIGMKLTAIALGACELYLNPDTNCSSWDTCAPEILLSEAGGELTDSQGAPLRYDNPKTTALQNGIVASNGPMHDFFVQRLADLVS